MTSRRCRHRRKSTVTASRPSFRPGLASQVMKLRSPVSWGNSLCGGQPEGGILQLHRDHSQARGVILDTSGSGLWGIIWQPPTCSDVALNSAGRGLPDTSQLASVQFRHDARIRPVRMSPSLLAAKCCSIRVSACQNLVGNVGGKPSCRG